MRTAEKVVLSWIDPGQVDGMFAVSVGELFRWRSSRIAGILRVEGGLVSRQRNQVAASFLTAEADWLFMIDSDQQLPIAAFDKMVQTAHAVERPVVAGLYFGAKDEGRLVPSPVPHLYRASSGVAQVPVIDYPPNQVIEVDAAGTGALLVHRRVFEQIREHADEFEGPDWCWFRDLPIDGNWLGEDFYFCRRIRSLGIPIVAHTGAVLPHRRRYWLDERQHEAARAFATEGA